MTRDGELRFKFASVQRELRDTQALARRFLHRSSVSALSDAADRLDFLRHTPGAHVWGLDEPLRTIGTRSYETKNRRGAHTVRGEIDSTWGITTEDPRLFRVTGNVSTRVRLIDESNGSELGRWRVELGAKDAPGSFFHTQIRGQSIDSEPPWPHSLPVPRLPTPFFSVPSVVVFLLGELFQSEWVDHARQSQTQSLATYQRQVLQRRLRWELDAIASGTSLPWNDLKAGLPPRELFCAPDIEKLLRA